MKLIIITNNKKNILVEKSSDWQQKIIVSIGIICVSLAAIFVRLCQQEIEEIFIGASRLIISTLILIPTSADLFPLPKK